MRCTSLEEWVFVSNCRDSIYVEESDLHNYMFSRERINDEFSTRKGYPNLDVHK